MLKEIAQLQAENSTAWLEIRHQGVMDAGSLRRQLYDAVEGSGLSILRIRTSQHLPSGLEQDHAAQSLDDLSVEEVFERCLESVELTLDERTELQGCFQEILSTMQMADHRSEE